MSNLEFIYPNIDRIKQLSAPLFFIHGDSDIKIDAAHSRLLFLKATGTEALADEAAADQFGLNAKNVSFASVSPAVTLRESNKAGSASSKRKDTGRAGAAGVHHQEQSEQRQCVYPVERHVVAGVGHNEVYAHRAWLSLVPAFLRRAEQFAEESGGLC